MTQSAAGTPSIVTLGQINQRDRPHPAVQTLRSLLRNKPAFASAIVLIVVTLCAVASGVIAPHDPDRQTLALRLVPPAWSDGGSWSHPLGTDALGRDLLSRLIYGARVSLIVGLSAVTIQALIGVSLGLIAGFRGGRLDSIIMAVTDIQYALPVLVVAIAIMAVLGPSMRNVIIVLGITGWVYYARLVRAQVLSLREQDFVEAAQAIGVKPGRIMFRHILPNATTQIIVVGSLQVAAMIISEASLSFLGLGIPPEIPSWGVMVAEGRTYISTGWWVCAFPGAAIFLTAMSVNLLGDWLREELDPSLKASGFADQ
ncbi:MAG: ABC transporter permease [Thermomicrobiales bacterium]|nr:ABC transporter permease [Thermomicrobiales bacterium]